MRFSRLRLNGFKSFVDPTELVISDGLTGVVGPNGCGKSNLLEALRWVMGENRASAMRGGGMEDVIFAGAATRPARNFAEVSLSIDNQDRLAPAGFNEDDTLEVVRRITRDAGSAYKANGKDTRARDVQMLFADASTGAHSPALVRQGQISELINAKPRARRRVLEEAAGISGLYQRRHEAELKLKGAETNLTRVDDVIEQLAGQLSSLARQARQAARYREIGTELRQAEGMLLYLRWREADQARARAEETLLFAVQSAAQAEAAAVKAAQAREEAEAAPPPKREEEAIAAAILQRLSVEHETLQAEDFRVRQAIEGLEARIEQLTRDIGREDSLNTDASETVAKLMEEREALFEARKGHDEALKAASLAAADAAEVLADCETGLSQLTEDAARLAARHQSAERIVSDARAALERNRAEAEKARLAAAEAEARLAEVSHDVDTAQTALASATEQANQAEAALAQAEADRATAQSEEGEARAALAEANGTLSTLESEVRALRRLLEREQGAAEQLLDHVKVDVGFEAAVGAALADDLKAPIRADGLATRLTGWLGLDQYANPQPLPQGAICLADVTRAPRVLARRLSQVGIVVAADGARLQKDLLPGQRLVSREGDLWRWDGYSLASEDSSSAAARRLQQVNQLEKLDQELTAAKDAADAARSRHDEISARLTAASEADKTARQSRRDADSAMAEASRLLSRAEAERNILAGRLETLTQAVSRHGEEAASAERQLVEAEAGQKALEDLTTMRARVESAKSTVEAARLTMLAKRTAHDEIKREGEARERRIDQIASEVDGWQKRLDTAKSRMAELNTRRIEAEAQLQDAKNKPDHLAGQRAELAQKIKDAEARKAAAADALSVAEGIARTATSAERDAERSASDAREARAAAEARRDGAAESVAHAAERIHEEMEVTPDALLEQLETDPTDMASAEKLEGDVMRLRRQRDALGAVNLRAEEDAREVQTEHDTLLSEKQDLEAAISKLRSGIAALNKEGRERLLTAFDEVNRNFGQLFSHLFGGGEARLVLVESDDPLEAGLEILCQPPGKKLSTLSLLSGGEQTLTALALIFAVFLANPAPICVLDEVDAPLDDANVTRFCDMLDEMTRRTKTRFLIITHHAVTMARMDRLFGVTMAEQGVSQLVSVDLKKAEALVA